MPEGSSSTVSAPSTGQRIVAEHISGPLLVTGAAGTGKTEALVGRAARLASGGNGARIATVTFLPSSVERLAERLEVGGADVSCLSLGALAERILRERAADADLDPFFERVGAGDRIAILLEHVERLPLRRHDIRGDATGLVTALVRRIDALRSRGIGPARFAEWTAERERTAGGEPEVQAAAREREFAEVYARHDQMLGSSGLLDDGRIVGEALSLLRERSDIAEQVADRLRHLLVDDLEDATPLERALLATLAGGARSLVAACDDRQGVRAFRAGTPAEADFGRRFPDAPVVRLGASGRLGSEALDAARAAVSSIPGAAEVGSPLAGERPRLRFWRCDSERAQAQAVAHEVERLLAGGDAEPSGICVVVGPGRHAGRAVAAALQERNVPVRLLGPGPFFDRVEVRDVLAWLRLLADPGDSAAIVRAVTRPPVELGSADVARCAQIGRRRRIDMIAALEAALESPHLRPEARDRIAAFLRLRRSASKAFEELAPDLLVRRLVERVGLRSTQLFSASPATVQRLITLSRLAELAAAWRRRHPRGATRELVRALHTLAEVPLEPGDVAGIAEGTGPADGVLVTGPGGVKGRELDWIFACDRNAEVVTIAPASAPVPEELASDGAAAAGDQHGGARTLYLALTRARRGAVLARTERAPGGAATPPHPAYEAARRTVGGREEEHAEALFAPGEELHAAFRALRDETLEAAWGAGRSLGELRLDTYMDVNRAAARHLELLKLAALLQRPAGQPLEEALKRINEVLEQTATPEQREALRSSSLDELLIESERDEDHRRRSLARSAEPSLEAFIPRRGEGLALSAGDVDLYRACPLKYKLARVLSIPQEPTINQRFGIVVHQVLERFHAAEGEDEPAEGGLERLLSLFDASWRRAGFGAGDDELSFRDRAVAALARYYERHRASPGTPVWLERPFQIHIGGHRVRGRIDRVDRLPDGDYELIDYKTGRHKTEAEIATDVQLALYRLAAREAWDVESQTQTYWYVLDDEKVPVSAEPDGSGRVEHTVLEVADGIASQDFEPRPSPELCPWCEYRVICPAAEV